MTAQPRRLQRKRTPGWKTPLDAQGRKAIYVGRPGRFGNPYPAYDSSEEERAAATLLFVNLLAERATHPNPEHLIAYPSDEEIRRELRGRDLLCWCPLPAPGQPDYCHAAYLLARANRA